RGGARAPERPTADRARPFPMRRAPAPPAPAITQTGAVEPAGSPYAQAQRPRPVATGAGGVAMRLVNSRRILLDYDLADVPKAAQTLLELWFTQDGRKWEKDNTALKSGSPYIVQVHPDGTYRFTPV